MEEVLSQIAVAGGQVTVSVGVIVAGGGWLIKKWSEKYAENQLLRQKNTELEAAVAEQKRRDTEDALTKIQTVIENHAKLFANLGERMRRLESRIEDQIKLTTHLNQLLERVMKLGTERVSVGKEATLVRDKKPAGEGEGSGV